MDANVCGMRGWFRRRREEADARVLEAIGQGSDYGVGIAHATRLGYTRVKLALYRLERSGRITSCWEEDPGDRPPRRLYEIASKTNE